ncbi:helix-turn-helix domain-containing protein [Clostridium sp.]|uniref:helix-turn-helix domain-containing protein n=1 Tax=Clostridium sp. TaxID=1506 RepID=UPI00261EFB75|nr:helix-turn-helix domain-containing protein [Clostridium sp.]
MNKFGDRLRQLRIAKELTQEELANQFGLHKTRISQYELNKRQADDELKKKFAKYFDVSVDYLIYNTEIKESADKLLKYKSTLITLHNSNGIDDELPDEAKKEIEDFIEYVKHKYKK